MSIYAEYRHGLISKDELRQAYNLLERDDNHREEEPEEKENEEEEEDE